MVEWFFGMRWPVGRVDRVHSGFHAIKTAKLSLFKKNLFENGARPFSGVSNPVQFDAAGEAVPALRIVAWFGLGWLVRFIYIGSDSLQQMRPIRCPVTASFQRFHNRRPSWIKTLRQAKKNDSILGGLD